MESGVGVAWSVLPVKSIPAAAPAAFIRAPTRGLSGVLKGLATPSSGMFGRSRNGCQRNANRSADGSTSRSADSTLRLPTKHQGHMRSLTMSMYVGDAAAFSVAWNVVIGVVPVGASADVYGERVHLVRFVVNAERTSCRLKRGGNDGSVAWNRRIDEYHGRRPRRTPRNNIMNATAWW